MPIPQSHTPRGYSEAKIPVTDSPVEDLQRIQVLSCGKCGALVLYYQTHDKWHKDQEKKPITGRGKW